MNPQQLAYEVRVLRQEKMQLLQRLDQMVKNQEKEKAIELFLAHAVSGYACHARATEEVFWEKDMVTGVSVPKDGGPEWVAKMSLKTMQCIIEELEGMVSLGGPEQEEVRASDGSSDGISAESDIGKPEQSAIISA